ncbi:MAG: AMP-binding protein [Desulfovibrio sp.]|uniref:AMP-binding protein n=1 Tax=Desulfovibrio sp. 7SRBS1 TaxID=3378064 RepID=UPI003B3EFCA4
MLISEYTLPVVLRHCEENYTHHAGFSFAGEESGTYGQFVEKVHELAGRLAGLGFRMGDKIAILGENMPNWGVAYFAITTLGCVVVPILPDFHPSAIQHILEHSESKALFVSEKLSWKVEEATAGLHTVFSVNSLEITSSVRPCCSEMQDGMDEAPYIGEDDLGAIIYTSGTTGHSKGVMLSHKNIVFNAVKAQELINIGGTERMLSILPLAHTYECTLGLVLPVLMGIHVSYLSGPPTPTSLVAAMGEVKPSLILSVPLIIEKIYKRRILPELTASTAKRVAYSKPAGRKLMHRLAGRKLLKTFGGNLRCFCIGGAPLSPDVERFLREAHFPYAVGYGMTETAPLLAGVEPCKTRYRSTGSVLPGVEMKIHDPDPETGEGEIWVRGPNIMLGYYKAPELTCEVMDEDGWLQTGDLGVMNEDGYLYIKGRLKNVIIGPSGENIYPEEIEAVMNEFDGVLESLVYEQGNRLVAKVHLDYERLEECLKSVKTIESAMRSKVMVFLEDLRTRLNRNLAQYSHVHTVIEQEEPFEKTPTQKIKRFLYVASECSKRANPAV